MDKWNTLVSIFDHSGAWSEPWSESLSPLEFDIKNEISIDALEFCCEWLNDCVLDAGVVDCILAAPPCTDFTSAGAQYWPKKDAEGITDASLELVFQTLRTIEYLKPETWAIEQPVGRLGKLIPELGKARLIFDPCDYAGYMNPTNEEIARLDELRTYYEAGKEFSQEDIEMIKHFNCYTKRTCLWGKFKIPEKKRIEPIRVCKQGSWLQKLGGKSEKTKAARSVTPGGFAKAFYEANWNDNGPMYEDCDDWDEYDMFQNN